MRKLARASALAILCALVNPQLAGAQSAESCSFGQPIVGAKRPNGDWGFGVQTRYEDSHTGVDYVYQAETPVVAVESGKVVYAGWWPPEGESAGYGFGPSVWIRHPCGSRNVMGFYAHLTGSTIAVVPGQQVARGQVIGFIAPKGAGGPAVDIAHLHLGFKEDGDPALGYGWAADWLNPDTYLAATEPLPEEEPPTPREETTVWGHEEWMPYLAVLGAVFIFLVWLGPLRLAGASEMAGSIVYHLFWGPTPSFQRAMRFARLPAFVLTCITLAMWIFLYVNAGVNSSRTAVVATAVAQTQQTTECPLTFTSGDVIAPNTDTHYAAIYGRFDGWGSVGTLPDAQTIVECAIANAQVVSGWLDGRAIQPVVILNIHGAGSPTEDRETVMSILTEAQNRNVIVMLDVQPTPDGTPISRLCDEAIGYIPAYPGGVWLSIDSEHFLEQSFPADEINSCSESYNETLRQYETQGLVGVWEFGVFGRWLIDDPKSVIRLRSNSIVIPLFSGFGAYETKVSKLQKMRDAYGGGYFGVAEWQSLYHEQYDSGFEPYQLLEESPIMLIRY